MFRGLFLLIFFASLWAEPHSFSLERLQNILQNKYLSGVDVGIEIYDLTSQQHLFSKNAEKLLSVASNNKIITTFAALSLLGRNYVHETEIKAIGDIEEGVLKGDLVLVGHGDPNISSRFYKKTMTLPEMWAKEIKKLGIHTIEGNLLAQDDDFDQQWISPNWPQDQLLNWYCAPTSALSFNDNCMMVFASPGASLGSLAQIETDPPLNHFFTIHNSMKTVEKGQSVKFSAYRKLGTNEIYVKGQIPLGARRQQGEMTIHNPTLYLLSALQESLLKESIQIRGQVGLETQPREGKTLVCTTHPLFKTLSVINKHSQNFYAEQLFKILGKHQFGKGSFENGAKAIHDLLKSLGHEQFEVVDGSGLSRGNRYSPRLIVEVLRLMYQHSDRDYYAATLPISGEDGSLRKRLGGPYKGRVRAKTGYISNVSSLSGYVRTRSNRVYAFSFLFNGFTTAKYPAGNSTMKDIQDSLLKALIDHY